MPGGRSRKKKKFINKKESITFTLVHRSQKDPLLVSEGASKHVLVEARPKDKNEFRKDEQQKYGVFYDDDYDYMQHLMEAKEIYELEMAEEGIRDGQISTIHLPSCALPSQFEKPVGLLNQAVQVRGPQPDWDPDIVAALDDDFDFDDPDNELQDNFMELANALTENDEYVDRELNAHDCVDPDTLGDNIIQLVKGNSKNDEQDGSELASVSDLASDAAECSDDEFEVDKNYGDNAFMTEETKSKFSNYSMSSSVIQRNAGLQLLDARFEKLYEQYDKSEIGGLDLDDIHGSVKQGSHILNSLLEEFEQAKKPLTVDDVKGERACVNVDKYRYERSDSSDEDMVTVVIKPKPKWDCETILSIYSECNQPMLIPEPKTVQKKIKLKGPHNIPEGTLGTRGLTKRDIDEAFREREKHDRAITYRPKDETPNEKKQRKQATKQQQKERKQEKKQNKTAFTKEKIRQDKELMNLNANLKAVQIV